VAALEVAALAVAEVDSQEEEEEVAAVVAFREVSQLTCTSEVPMNTASDFYPGWLA
jgi:hypothetical protein